jgi:hypothetical protein
MKIIFITYIFAISLCCGENSKTKKEIKLNTIESRALINPTITSITFTNGEIIGANHFGYKYDFSINITSSNNLDILSFCKENFSTILNGRVTDNEVITSIMNKLNNGEVDIDENPQGLRLGASTQSFDTIEVEIFLKEDNLLKIDLKYYSPL